MRKNIHQVYEDFIILSSKRKLFSIIFTHFILRLLIEIIFFLDDFSILYQLLSSILHLTFLIVLVDSIYKKESSIWISKKIQKILLALFILANFIPFRQPFLIFDDTPFTARWEVLPQTQFGFPSIYLRFFSEEAQELYGGENPPIILHANYLFHNLYISGLFIITFLKVKNRIKRNKK